MTENSLTINFSLEQSRAMHRLTNPKYKDVDRVVFGGKAGGGKSFLICIWLDYMAMKYPGTRYYLGRETLKDVKDSVLLTYFDVMAMFNRNYIYREHKSHIYYPETKSYIYLVECFQYPSDPDFQTLGSREYTAGAIEEGITVTKRAADLLISRTRYKHDVYDLTPKQLITCNPGNGWIKDEIVTPQLEGKPKRANVCFIPASLESNPNKEFAARYKKTLEENLSSFDRARLLEGDWDAQLKTGAEYLKDFNADIHVQKCEYDPNLPLHFAFDENVNPHITCLVFQINSNTNTGLREVRQIAEICPKSPLNTRKYVCTQIIKTYPQHKTGVFIYGDASSRKQETSKEKGENFFTDIMQGLKQYNPQLRVPSKNPAVMSKGGFMNLILEKNYKLIKWIIDPSCKSSISDYAYAIENSEGGINKKKVTDPETGIQYEKHGHFIDAASYFFTRCFMSEYNHYLSGGQSYSVETGSDRSYQFMRDLRDE